MTSPTDRSVLLALFEAQAKIDKLERLVADKDISFAALERLCAAAGGHAMWETVAKLERIVVDQEIQLTALASVYEAAEADRMQQAREIKRLRIARDGAREAAHCVRAYFQRIAVRTYPDSVELDELPMRVVSGSGA